MFGDPGNISVDVGSLAAWRGDREELEALDAQVWIAGDDAGPALTADRARSLAALLVEAADWLEADHR